MTAIDNDDTRVWPLPPLSSELATLGPVFTELVAPDDEPGEWESWKLVRVTWRNGIESVFLRHLDKWVQLVQGGRTYDRDAMLEMLNGCHLEEMLLVTAREYREPLNEVIFRLHAALDTLRR